MGKYIDKTAVDKILRKLWKEYKGGDTDIARIAYNNALQEVQCEIDNLVLKEEAEWKDASITPPFTSKCDGNEYSASVLCKDEFGYYYIAQYVRWRTGWCGWIDADENEVVITHWKELPKEQKGE